MGSANLLLSVAESDGLALVIYTGMPVAIDADLGSSNEDDGNCVDTYAACVSKAVGTSTNLSEFLPLFDPVVSVFAF